MANKFSEALDTGNFIAGSVCVDCLFGIANGEWPTVGENWTQAQQDSSDSVLAAYDVTLGHLHSGEWSNCHHKDEPCEEDCECEQTTFSSARCDVCRSTLSGSRDDVIMVNKEDLK